MMLHELLAKGVVKMKRSEWDDYIYVIQEGGFTGSLRWSISKKSFLAQESDIIATDWEEYKEEKPKEKKMLKLYRYTYVNTFEKCIQQSPWTNVESEIVKGKVLHKEIKEIEIEVEE